jgi:glutamyl-tRNA synthetase
MHITHAFRGEEWLPSSPVHILLWRYLFGENVMPQWAHFPLILGPNGKLSKRDGAKYGFPVFAMQWSNPKTNELTQGFREQGFLPEAFINMLAMLGWNDGTEQEIFSLEELIQKFTIEKVHKSGAKFDFEKAKWYNHEWIKKLPVSRFSVLVSRLFEEKGLTVNDTEKFEKVLELVKARCSLLTDFYEQSYFFFSPPADYDIASVKPKWNESKASFFESFCAKLEGITEWNSAFIENAFKNLALVCNIKPGDLQLPLRIMLVGGKFGPPVFDIAEILGKNETVQRVKKALSVFKD